MIRDHSPDHNSEDSIKKFQAIKKLQNRVLAGSLKNSNVPH